MKQIKTFNWKNYGLHRVETWYQFFSLLVLLLQRWMLSCLFFKERTFDVVAPLTPFVHQDGKQSSFLVRWFIFSQTWNEKMVNQFHAVSFKREMSAVSLKRVHCDFFATHKELQLHSWHHSDKFFILLTRNGYTNTEKKKFQN